MAGRNSQPIQLIKSEGNKNRKTKAELEHREKMEQSVYTGEKFKESPATKSDPVAHKEFLRLKRLYKHIQYIDGLDQQTINRYCQMISQEKQLQAQFDDVQNEIDKCEKIEKRLGLYDFLNKATTKLNQTRDALIKLEDRMLLNPSGRMKAIPKKPPEKKEESGMAKFMKSKAGGKNAN